MARRRNNGASKYVVRKAVASNLRKVGLDWRLSEVEPDGDVRQVGWFHDREDADFAAKCLNTFDARRSNPKRRKNTRWEEREERVPRSRKELIGYIYALTNALERDFGADYTVAQINRMDMVELKKDAQRLAHWLRTSGGDENWIAYAYSHAAEAYNHLERMVPGGFSSRVTKFNPRRRR